jgi:hypothetical protein
MSIANRRLRLSGPALSLGALTLGALLLAGAPWARAQMTTWDFTAPGPNQQGSYQPDPTVTLAGGVASLQSQQTPRGTLRAGASAWRCAS